MASQNNVVMTNYIQAKIDYTQQNREWGCVVLKTKWLNECSTLAPMKNKPRHDWVGKIIHWELCKKLKFDYTI